MSDLWYALRVRSRFEKLVQTQLEEKGYEVFLPQRVVHSRWSDREKTLSLPLFPNYVFCRFDSHQRLPVLLTPGVHSAISTGKMPVAVDETELSALRRVIDSHVTYREWPYLRDGSRVQVMAGPLEGLDGIVITENGKDRVIVSLSLLMRSVAVEIDRKDIRLLGHDLAARQYHTP